jgi:hypothetical protein
MLMPIGNTVPKLQFRGLPGSIIAGNQIEPLNRSRADSATEEPARQSRVSCSDSGVAVRASSVLPWRWW